MTQAAILSQLGSQGTTQGFKNRIINGAMVIDQRNAGASVTPTTATYTLDRWQATCAQSSKYSVQQVSDAPTGFVNSLKITSLSSYTVLSGETFTMRQIIEGSNLSDLGWGGSLPKTVSISFWAKSSLTGNFGVVLGNGSVGRTYGNLYTINAANTWEYKTVTVPGDTVAFPTGNTQGLYLIFGLGVASDASAAAGSWQSSFYYGVTGATSVVGTNGATLQITGVQLEVGSAATNFDTRSYQQELAMCQRYYEYNRTNFHVFPRSTSNNQGRGSAVFAVCKRTTPTMTLTWANVGGSQGSEGVYPEGFGFYDNSTMPNYLYGNGATPYSWKAEAEL